MTTTAALLSSLLALCLGCTKATSTNDQGVAPQPKPQPQPQTVGDVSVEIAGITLGEDCGSGTIPPPPAPLPAKRAPSAVSPTTPPVDQTSTPGAVSQPSSYRCLQTSVQLAVIATAIPGATPVKVKKVELLDASGKLLGELAATSPLRWSDKGAYEAWAETIAPNEQAQISYVLAAPRWDAMEGGRYGQANKLFQVRVTVAIGANDKVLEKKAIQPTIMPPAVPT